MGHLQSVRTTVEVVVLVVLHSQHFAGALNPVIQLRPGCGGPDGCRLLLDLLCGRKDGIDLHGLVVQTDAGYMTEGQWRYGNVIDFRILFRFFRLTAIFVVFAEVQRLGRHHVVHVYVLQGG